MDSSIIVIDDSDDEIEKKMAKNEEEDNVEGYTSGSDVSPMSSKSADKEDEEEPKKVVHTTTPTNSCEKPKAKKRQVEYEAVEEDENLEAEIDLIKRITDLTPKQIEYMVLRDVNYFLDIFSGECEHSWRHREYKKFSKKTGNYLYENSRLSAYTYDQYMGAVQGLQYIFCKKDFRYNEYIVKVLLPEALIKICMRIYQCSKDAAEEFLKMNFDKNPNLYPRGSAVYSPATTKTLAPSSSSSSTSAESKSIKTSTSSSSLSTRPSASKLVVTASPKSKSKIEQFILLD